MPGPQYPQPTLQSHPHYGGGPRPVNPPTLQSHPRPVARQKGLLGIQPSALLGAAGRGTIGELLDNPWLWAGIAGYYLYTKGKKRG